MYQKNSKMMIHRWLHIQTEFVKLQKFWQYRPQLFRKANN